ncbi:2-oxo-4-hydroxy-4-carboxy-5-ureidoimidazoline decarboxylase [Streptomyces sp. NPDC096310]|uniref:2-oxo-4-hydroxy-4-carboxy-5-ureidoimidazoline decarboxylase n=1 Tax=Streptomyces sp. NPDC096310 TaxID=3366082 RepID=UPI0037F8E653
MTSTPPPAPGLTRFNASPDAVALAALREVCASPAWGVALLARRPYATEAELLATGDTLTAELTDAELTAALAGHPPIGRPKPGDPASAREQRGMAGAPAPLKAEMAELNLAYQERFGHVFLICATGATAEEMRDALRTRLGHTPEREREITRTELGRINRVRLSRLVAVDPDADPSPGPAPAPASVSTHILDTSAGRPAGGVSVALAARTGDEAAPNGAWAVLGGSVTGPDGRCTDLPALPPGTTRVRLTFATGPYLDREKPAGTEPDAPAPREGGTPFFPEVAVAFTVTPGEHYHVPLLLNPFGYSVYRGS